MPSDDLKVRKRIYRLELGAYVLIVCLAVFGFWRQEETQRDICEAVESNRQVAVDLVESVHGLGTSVVVGDRSPNRPLSQPEKDFLERLDQFRDERLATLGEAQNCD